MIEWEGNKNVLCPSKQLFYLPLAFSKYFRVSEDDVSPDSSALSYSNVKLSFFSEDHIIFFSCEGNFPEIVYNLISVPV